MGEIKARLERLAAELPRCSKPNRAVKTTEIQEAMPAIEMLMDKGYSLYRISLMLREDGISISYSLLKCTVAKLLREKESPIEWAVDFSEP